MERLLLLFAFLLTRFFFQSMLAGEMGAIKAMQEVKLPVKIQSPLADPLPAGTYTIGTVGDFTTIDSAFNKLSIDGISGEVTLELIDTLYIAPTDSFGFFLNGPIPGVGPDSRVIIRPGANKNVTIEGSGLTTVTFLNTNYVTVDGICLTGATTLTVHTYSNMVFAFNDGIDFMNNSDHNILQNIIFINEDIMRESGSGFFSFQTGSAPDSNLMQNNFVKKAGESLFIISPETSLRGKGNVIRGNQIGSESDSLINCGIEAINCENTIIENNCIQNLKVTIIGSSTWKYGIISISGLGDIIRGNVLHDFKTYSAFMCTGILLTSWGTDIQVYNNMIYNMHSTSISYNSHVSGIEMFEQNNPKIYYNSVYLSGTGGSYNQGSAPLCMLLNCINAEVKNNIFVNTRNEAPYSASAIFDITAPAFISDNNDLYYDTSNTNNCLVRAGGIFYQTLTDWMETGNDSNSVNELPNFIAPYLHIDASIPSYLESRATPIAGIDTDFDGESRNTMTSDIGADEIDGIPIVGIENKTTIPTEFTLEQNYPNPFNPSTTIQFQIPKNEFVTLKIFNLLGEEVTTLVSKQLPAGSYTYEWDGSNVASGVYLYRIEAEGFVQTRKMVLMR